MSGSMPMIDVVELDDGRFAVRRTGGSRLEETLGEFNTRSEAEAFVDEQGFEAGDDGRLETGGHGQGVR